MYLSYESVYNSLQYFRWCVVGLISADIYEVDEANKEYRNGQDERVKKMSLKSLAESFGNNNKK